MSRLGIAHTAIDVTNGPIASGQYPPGTMFHGAIEHVDIEWDRITGGWKMTQHMRITHATDPAGKVIPYPSEPLEIAEPPPNASFPVITGKRWDEPFGDPSADAGSHPHSGQVQP